MNMRWVSVGVFWTVVVSVPAGGTNPEIVTIRGERHQIWPAEDLRARGFDLLDVPRDQNAAWVYIEAINAYDELPASLEEAFTYAYTTAWPAGHSELTQYLKRPGNRQAMERVRRAAGMEQYQMPYFGDPESSVLSFLLPNLSSMRMLGKLLVAEGRRLEAEGEYDRAMETYLVTLRMGSHVSYGATLIEGLVGLSIWRVGSDAIVAQVLRQPLSGAQLERLQRKLDAHASKRPSVDRGLRGEQAFGPNLVDEFCAQPLRVSSSLRVLSGSISDGDLGGFGGNPHPDDGWSRLEARIGRLILPDRAVKRHMRGYYERVIERAQLGPVAGDFDEQQYLTQTIPRWDGLSRALLPSLSRATTHGERVKAELAMLRTTVAIRLFMLRHYGAAPASLDALEDLLSDEAMVDSFSGDALVYRSTGNGWVLYSVGPNLVDDGGREGTRWDELDMVHRLPPGPIDPFVAGDEDDGDGSSDGSD